MVLSQTGYLHRNMVAWRMKFSGRHFPKDVILTAVRWYLRYNLSYRDVEELIAERGIVVDHSTINRWVVKYAALLVEAGQESQTKGGYKLATGRNLHQGAWSMEILVSSCR